MFDKVCKKKKKNLSNLENIDEKVQKKRDEFEAIARCLRMFDKVISCLKACNMKSYFVEKIKVEKNNQFMNILRCLK